MHTNAATSIPSHVPVTELCAQFSCVNATQKPDEFRELLINKHRSRRETLLQLVSGKHSKELGNTIHSYFIKIILYK